MQLNNLSDLPAAGAAVQDKPKRARRTPAAETAPAIVDRAPGNAVPMSADDTAAHLAYKSAFEFNADKGRVAFKASRMREALIAAGYEKADARSIVDSYILRHKAVLSMNLSCDSQGRVIRTTRQFTGDVDEAVRAHNIEARENRKALQLAAIKAGAPRLLAYRDDLLAKS